MWLINLFKRNNLATAENLTRVEAWKKDKKLVSKYSQDNKCWQAVGKQTGFVYCDNLTLGGAELYVQELNQNKKAQHFI